MNFLISTLFINIYGLIPVTKVSSISIVIGVEVGILSGGGLGHGGVELRGLGCGGVHREFVLILGLTLWVGFLNFALVFFTVIIVSPCLFKE